MTRGRKKRLPPGERSRDFPDRQAHEIERLKQENERLRKQLEEQQKKIADLERQLALRQELHDDLQASVIGWPRGPTTCRRVKSRRSPGGQPGHPGRHRAPVPIERVDTIIDLVPDTCRRCGHRLSARHSVGDARRHQVTELPVIAAHITEYRCHRRQCPACGMTTSRAAARRVHWPILAPNSPR
jgi:hypothetical protein